MRARRLHLGVLAALAAACTTSAALDERSAVIVQPSAAGRAELLRAVRAGLDGAEVTLADDALTHDSVLVIEPMQRRDGAGRLLDGRERRRPEHFRLVISARQCVLVQERTLRRWVLRASRCQAE